MSSCEKKVIKYFEVKNKHWVGNGFNVHGLLRPSPELNKLISPFIMLDYASPKYFNKTSEKRGVGEHPHRGFETVTIAYQGEVEHRDSSGGGGVIQEGDVQWMTAGSGIVHDEFHSKKFSETGGHFEMIQLWINLPKKDKLTTPKYQSIQKEQIPIVTLDHGNTIRVIAGKYEDVEGPGNTFTEINMFDLISEKESSYSFKFKKNTNTIILVMDGFINIDNIKYDKQNVIIFEQGNETINFTTSSQFKGLLLNGEPIDEPIVAYGPFVMNTKDEIIKAIEDYNMGIMGSLMKMFLDKEEEEGEDNEK
jgi:quercetin 2,3-dioxygenase